MKSKFMLFAMMVAVAVETVVAADQIPSRSNIEYNPGF